MHSLYMIATFSFDSFIASFIIGCGSIGWRARITLAAGFGICDAAAAAVGSLLPPVDLEFSQFAIYAVCVTLLGANARNRRPAFLYALPILLSVDNLFCGSSVQSAPVLGLGSCVSSLLGFGAAALGKKAIRATEVPWESCFMQITACWRRVVRKSSCRPLSTRTPLMRLGGGIISRIRRPTFAVADFQRSCCLPSASRNPVQLRTRTGMDFTTITMSARRTRFSTFPRGTVTTSACDE
jgi:hypothetical protein